MGMVVGGSVNLLPLLKLGLVIVGEGAAVVGTGKGVRIGGGDELGLVSNEAAEQEVEGDSLGEQGLQVADRGERFKNAGEMGEPVILGLDVGDDGCGGEETVGQGAAQGAAAACGGAGGFGWAVSGRLGHDRI